MLELERQAKPNGYPSETEPGSLRDPAADLDRRVLVQLALDAGTSLLQAAAATFLREGDLGLARIRAALASGDSRALRRELHTLKSCAATFGALRLSDQAAALEQAAVEGRIDAVVAGLSELQALVAVAVPLLRNAVADLAA